MVDLSQGRDQQESVGDAGVSSAQELIEKIARGEDREAATRQLAKLGAAAVEPALDSLRSMSAPPFLVAEALFQVEDKSAIDPLLRATRDESTMVQLTVIEALGYLGSPIVLAALTELLQHLEVVPTAKRVAAYAVGICGSAESLPALVRAQAEAIAEKERELVIACAVSRARLGDHGGLAPVLDLTRFKGDETLRASAVQALRYVAGPGVFPALAQALKDRAREVRRAAVEAIYYLGNHTAMEYLLTAAADRDDETANNSRVYLEFLSGTETSDKALERKKWWLTHQSRFRAEWCYRNGNPVSLDQFVALLIEDANVPEIARDFVIYTGQWIGSEAWIRTNPREARSRVIASIALLGNQFERGAVYKSGTKFEMGLLQEERGTE